MSWRSRRDAGKAEQALAGSVVARVTAEQGSASAGEVAVRGALARAEVDRRIDRLAVVTLDDAPFARVLAAVLARDRNVTVAPLDVVQVDGVDGAFAVVRRSSPAAEVVASLERLAPVLLGVVLVEDAKRPAGQPREEDGDRLAELTHREAALRRITEDVERQRAQLEQRERELEGRDDSTAAEREAALDEREAKLDERAESLDARERRIEERVRELEEGEEALAAER